MYVGFEQSVVSFPKEGMGGVENGKKGQNLYNECGLRKIRENSCISNTASGRTSQPKMPTPPESSPKTSSSPRRVLKPLFALATRKTKFAAMPRGIAHCSCH